MDTSDQSVLDGHPVGDPPVARPSVFDRLSGEGANTKKPMSFADAVGDKSSAGLSFFPMEDKKAVSIMIPMELAKEAAKSFSTTIVGYFLGSRIPFPIVHRYLMQVWSKHGVSDIMMNAKGFFFIKFNDEGGSIRAMEEGMIMVRGVPMFLSPWDPSKGLSKPSHETCPLWVKFHNIPLVLFNQKLEVKIPHLHDDGHDAVSIDIEYIWEPSQCTHCCVFGHKRNVCTKAPIIRSTDKKNKQVDEEGFTTVVRQQWKRKVDKVPSVHQEGLTSGSKELNDLVVVEDKGSDDVPGKQEDAHSKEIPEQLTVDVPTVENESNDLDGREVVIMREGVSSVSKVNSPPREDIGVSIAPNVAVPPVSMVSVTPFKEDRSTTMGPTVPPKAPIKGILKNPNRFSVLSGSVEPRKDSRDDGNGRRKSSDDKGDICNYTFGNWNWCSNQLVCDHGTRIIIAWDIRRVDIVTMEVHAQFVHYNRTVPRRSLWSGLRKFKVLIRDMPWLIMGDFNTMLFPHDGLGGSSRRNADMIEFGECLADIDMYDVQYTGVQYTWCQKPSDESGIRRKLDRVLANNEFTTRFSDVTVQFLPRGLSDHSAAITSFTGGVRHFVAPFKFDNFLTNDPRFYDILNMYWNNQIDGTFMHRVLSKLKALKTPLRKLRSSFHNLSTAVVLLKPELDVVQLACDLDPDNVLLQEDVQAIRGAYLKACYNEEQAAKQRAKVRWLLEGDSNSKFFHQVVREKRHVHRIHSVMDVRGTYVYNQEVPDAFVEHLQLYLGVCDDSLDPTMQSSLFSSRLSLVDALDMIRPISDDDIKRAMFSIGSNKAPGSDGFSSKFFKKVIVDRMKTALDVVVGKYQSAFIPGRKIVDNILLAHELVIGYHKDVGQPRCAFKIDIRKAYDMVDWRFLINMLHGLGFHPVLIKWIQEMVSTTTFSVAINGETRGYFHGKRGIRQGDPLSPYLFTLIMEGFSLIFRQCISEAEEFGYHKGCAQFNLTHLCFAGDLFVFTRGDVQSVEVLKKALSIFASKSGLSANLEKSEIFFGNVPVETRKAIRAFLPFRNGIFPIRYLGVPLSPVRLKRADYGGLILKVKNRIQNWKAKFLSFGGTRQLILSVLHSLQLYWMGVFNFPASVLHEIESLFRNFLWHQDITGRGNCRVAWEMVCKPIVNRGLGFKRLGWWNKALLAQHMWDLATKRDSLWVRWVLNSALKGANLWVARKSSRWSWVLSKIMDIRPLFRQHIQVTVGNGVHTNAWDDNWLMCGPLSDFISSRFVYDNGFTMETSVADLGTAIQGTWPQDWVSRFHVLSTINFPILNDDRDSFKWRDDDNLFPGFSVKVAYKALQGDLAVVPWHASVWFKGCIPKHAFCMWLACWRRLPTQDRMLAWKEEPPDYTCMLSALNWLNFPTNWDDIVMAISDHATAPTRFVCKLALAAMVYEIWIERNKRIFTDEKRSMVQITQTIMRTIELREDWKKRQKLGNTTHGL
ncbi:hypothetical protein OSB04_un000299 [Centaurea solstitialis]|uniref:Reverse transcriptase domain-containing protein n=1 Tax=Centaurea solstitialis TaxID=347529 RepID=A0AA38SNY0_9ASTR|nr:hypothetical protein OSB04_un000299 [Centaurea solstitialis]